MQGLEFDAINDNLPETIEKYRVNTRKVYADVYIDDSSVTSHDTNERKNKLGKWVGIHAYCGYLEETTGDKYTASGLGNYIYCNKCWQSSKKRYNFCPNCGATMFDFGETCKQAMMEHEEV